MLNILPRSTLFIQQGSNIQKQHVPCSKIQMVTMFMRLICIFLHRERAKFNSRSKLPSFFQTAKHPSKSKRHSIFTIYILYIYIYYIYKYVKVSGFPPFLWNLHLRCNTVPCCVSPTCGHVVLCTGSGTDVFQRGVADLIPLILNTPSMVPMM